MKDRLKELRNSEHLTQQEFADRIGIQRSTYAKYEIGRNEPIDAVIKLICDTFHVNEQWLRTGKGEMKVQMDREHEMHRLVDELLADDSQEMKKRLATAVLRLTPEQMEAALTWIKDTFGLVEGPVLADRDVTDTNVGNTAAAVSDLAKRPDEMTREELHARLDAELDLVEEGKGEDIDGTA